MRRVAAVRSVRGVLDDGGVGEQLHGAPVVSRDQKVTVRGPVARVDVRAVAARGPYAHDGEAEDPRPRRPPGVHLGIQVLSTGPRVPVQQLVVGAVAGQHRRVFRPVEVTHSRAVALALGLEGVTPARPAPHQEYIQRGVPRAHRQARVIWRVLDVLDGRTLGHDRAKYRAQRLFVKHGECPVRSPDGDVMRPLVVPGGLCKRLVAARHRTRREPDVGASEHLGLGRAPQVQAAAL